MKKPETIFCHSLAAVLLAVRLLWTFCIPGDFFSTVPTSTVVVDRKGELLGVRIADDGQWRFPRMGEADKALPRKYVLAVVEFEDRGFRYHGGVSVKAALRALFQNIRGGRTVSGASTITMQVIRLYHPRPRTLPSKIVEAFMATRLESLLSKDRILSLYAAAAPFGGNVVGLEAACWRYLGRPPEEISWAEAATLAVLPNAPSSINLSRNREDLLSKRDRLLGRLHERGYIPDPEYEMSLEEPLIGEIHPFPSLSSHLVDRCDATSHGQYCQVEVDASLQVRAEAICKERRDALSLEGINDLCAVILEVDSTGVREIVHIGNADPLTGRVGAQVDITRSARSSGSVLKPLLYCAALQEGAVLPSALLPDVPMDFGGFAPRNYSLSYDGAVAADEALARSLNIPFVQLLSSFGVRRFAALLKNEGISLSRPVSSYGLSLALGGAEVSLGEIARSYASLALLCMGQRVEGPLDDPLAAWYTLRAMSCVVRPDGLDSWTVSSLRKVAWKTGTSWGGRDAWAVGVVPGYVVGVWAGNASGEGSPNLRGVTSAGPVMFDLFGLLPPTGEFSRPEGEEVGEMVQVCTKSGFLAGYNCKDTEQRFLPHSALSSRVCPYHAEGGEFTLPPLMASYYVRNHPDYGAVQRGGEGTPSQDGGKMQIVYPREGMVLSSSRQMDGEDGGMIFSLVHGDGDKEVYWHLDRDYLGQTLGVHKMRVNPPCGVHTLTCVDGEGNEDRVSFKVI